MPADLAPCNAALYVNFTFILDKWTGIRQPDKYNSVYLNDRSEKRKENEAHMENTMTPTDQLSTRWS